jgi:hypothetical protein
VTRRLVDVATALSLLLLAATLAAWLRSQWRHEFRVVNGGGTIYHVGYVSRGFYVGQFLGVTTNYQESHPFLSNWSSSPASVVQFDVTARRALGFVVVRRDYTQPHPYVTFRELVVPFWAVACVFAMVPALRVVRHALQKPRPGFCRDCGYDLRATPDRCPECGSEAAPGSRERLLNPPLNPEP